VGARAAAEAASPAGSHCGEPPAHLSSALLPSSPGAFSGSGFSLASPTSPAASLSASAAWQQQSAALALQAAAVQAAQAQQAAALSALQYQTLVLQQATAAAAEQQALLSQRQAELLGGGGAPPPWAVLLAPSGATWHSGGASVSSLSRLSSARPSLELPPAEFAGRSSAPAELQLPPLAFADAAPPPPPPPPAAMAGVLGAQAAYRESAALSFAMLGRAGSGGLRPAVQQAPAHLSSARTASPRPQSRLSAPPAGSLFAAAASTPASSAAAWEAAAARLEERAAAAGASPPGRSSMAAAEQAANLNRIAHIRRMFNAR